jgi:hypothetical protein
MNNDDIRSAINDKLKLYFCEGRSGVNQVVECIPVAMYIDDQTSVVGVFVPNGIRVATVDGWMIGADPYEAQQQMSRKNRMIATLLEKCWTFSDSMIENAKRSREASQGSDGMTVIPVGRGDSNVN